MDVVVVETAEICDGCTIKQGVALGGASLYKGTKRHPKLGIDVVVSAGATAVGIPARKECFEAEKLNELVGKQPLCIPRANETQDTA